jgi:hypothetical protein
MADRQLSFTKPAECGISGAGGDGKTDERTGF